MSCTGMARWNGGRISWWEALEPMTSTLAHIYAQLSAQLAYSAPLELAGLHAVRGEDIEREPGGSTRVCSQSLGARYTSGDCPPVLAVAGVGHVLREVAALDLESKVVICPNPVTGVTHFDTD